MAFSSFLRLGGGEGQVAAADLHQLPRRAQPPQRDRRISAGGHDGVGLADRMRDERLDGGVAGGVADHVVVVQHDHDWLAELVQLGRDPPHQRLNGDATDRMQHRLDAGAERGHDLADRQNDTVPQLDRVVLRRLQRDKREPARIGRLPLRQQRRFAEPRRSRDHDERALGFHQPLRKAGPLDQPGSPRGGPELRCEHDPAAAVPGRGRHPGARACRGISRRAGRRGSCCPACHQPNLKLTRIQVASVVMKRTASRFPPARQPRPHHCAGSPLMVTREEAVGQVGAVGHEPDFIVLGGVSSLFLWSGAANHLFPRPRQDLRSATGSRSRSLVHPASRGCRGAATGR